MHAEGNRESPLDNRFPFFTSDCIHLYATKGTADFLRANNIESKVLHWPLEKKCPNTMDYLSQGKIDLVINIPKNYQQDELANDYIIRRQAVNFGIPLITNIQLAQRFVEALSRKQLDDLEIKSWGEYGNPPGFSPRIFDRATA